MDLKITPADAGIPAALARFDRYFPIEVFGGKKIQAIRVTWLYAGAEIRRDSGFLLLPRLGTIAFNVSLYPGYRWEVTRLPKRHFFGPQFETEDKVDFIPGGYDLQDRYVPHSYFVAGPGLTRSILVEVAVTCERDYGLSLSGGVQHSLVTHKRVLHQPESAAFRTVDHVQNHLEVGLDVIKRQFPRTWNDVEAIRRASQGGRSNSPVSQTQIAEDLYFDLRLQGFDTVELQDINTSLRSGPFIQTLERIVRQKAPVSEVEKLLFRGWIAGGYLNMSNKQLADEILRHTQKSVKPNTLRQTYRRMGLKTSTSIGRPPG